MINPHRGEVAIKLVRANDDGADDLVLRPTFDAITALEVDLDVGLSEILRRFSERRFGMRDIVAIVSAGLAATGHLERRDVIGERVAATGVYTLSTPCLQFCMNAWFGGQDPTTLPPMEVPATAASASPSVNGSGLVAVP